MRFKKIVPLLALALMASVALVARAQQQADPNEETVRGAFLSSRMTVGQAGGSASVGATTTSGGSSRTTHRTRTHTNRNTGKSTTTGKGTSTNTTATNKGITGNTTISANNKSSEPIGLGYTLYMRDRNGDAVRVDPDREFHAGDAIRISLETNVDGYLYVFHTENNGEPEMIFPDQRLDEGDNLIDAHVPTEIPSSQEQDERLRWFVFDNVPASERVYIVVTREPLPGVPTGDELVDYCHKNQNRCPWRATPAMWAQVKRYANSRVSVVKSTTYGQNQTQGEREATTRGLGLDQSAPPPSIIRMNVTSTEGVLVTALDLVHK